MAHRYNLDGELTKISIPFAGSIAVNYLIHVLGLEHKIYLDISLGIRCGVCYSCVGIPMQENPVTIFRVASVLLRSNRGFYE